MKTRRNRLLWASAFLFLPLPCIAAERKDKEQPLQPAELVRAAVCQLVKIQEVPGQWPYIDDERLYEGVPIGFRIAGTSFVAQALMFAAPHDKDGQAAVQRGLAFVLKHLDHPWLKPITEFEYDFRVWAHAFALDFLCQIRAHKLAGGRRKQVEEWIPRLIDSLVKEEMPDGGWNYLTLEGKTSGAHVTAPVVQALLLARAQGEKVPDEIVDRARQALEAARASNGAFVYSGEAGDKDVPIPGATCRSLVCATTLVLLGAGSINDVRSALSNFHKYWNELEERRKKTGYHFGPYAIAPYYVYYGHRYAGQAIQILPEKERAYERERLLKLLLQTRDADGTWNDRVFPRSRYVTTAMVVMALLGDRAPLPPRWSKR